VGSEACLALPCAGRYEAKAPGPRWGEGEKGSVRWDRRHVEKRMQDCRSIETSTGAVAEHEWDSTVRVRGNVAVVERSPVFATAKATALHLGTLDPKSRVPSRYKRSASPEGSPVRMVGYENVGWVLTVFIVSRSSVHRDFCR
jgi:hypothetical protein